MLCNLGSDICPHQEDHTTSPSSFISHGYSHRITDGHCYGGMIYLLHVLFASCHEVFVVRSMLYLLFETSFVTPSSM